MIDWKSKYASGGVCDFKQNYDFYFKWLVNKVASCFCIEDLPDSINQTFLKWHLLLDGNICVTDFEQKLYACFGGIGGEPDEYYRPTVFTIANPVLGSKQVYLRDFKDHSQTGVLISNTSVDSLLMQGVFDCGLYQLINQTASLLADNIVSIQCCQINTRVQSFVLAESEAQALAGESILKKMYAGRPYQILRSDLVEKITVNPIKQGAGTITELVELHNYIIANFFQNIGIKANDIRKKAHILEDEINSQNDYLQLSLTEILSSWQKGFDEVNAKYGTSIKVSLNPVLLHEIAEDFMESEPEQEQESEYEPAVQDTSGTEQEPEQEAVSDAETVIAEEKQEPADIIEEQKEVVADVVDEINDTTQKEDEPEEGEVDAE